MDAELPDLYAVLGVSPTATPHAVVLAYRGRIKHVHPDYATSEADRLRRTGSSVALNAAYAVLRDPAKRTEYDLRRTSAIADPLGTAHADGAPDEGSSRAAHPSRPRDDPLPGSDSGVRTSPIADDSFSGTLGNWLRLTHEGEWVALILAAIAIWLLGLLVGFQSPLGPDLTLLTVVLLVQPVLAGRWRETPLADLLCATKRLVRASVRCVHLVFAILINRAPSGRA